MAAESSNDLAALLERLQQAPHDALTWELFFKSAWPFVLTHAYALLGRSRRMADAEDVAQAALWLLSRSIHEGRLSLPKTDDEVHRLLTVIVRNQTRDLFRYERRLRRDIRRELAGTEREHVEHRLPAPETQLHYSELVDQVSKKLESFDRQLFQMQLAGASMPDMAERLKTTTRTIRRHLQEIRSVVLASITEFSK